MREFESENVKQMRKSAFKNVKVIIKSASKNVKLQKKQTVLLTSDKNRVIMILGVREKLNTVERVIEYET